MELDNDLSYDNVFEALFGRGTQEAADYQELARLAMKYEDSVQLFFGTKEELQYLEELKLQELERQGVEVVRD